MDKKEEVRKAAEAAVREHGAKKVKDMVFPTFHVLVEKSRFKQSLGVSGPFMLNVGLEHVDCVKVLGYIECVLESLPDGAEKDAVMRDHEYWVSHEGEILADNRIPPVVI